MDYRIKIAILIAALVLLIALAVVFVFVFARLVQKWIRNAERKKLPDTYALMMACGLLLLFASILTGLDPLVKWLGQWLHEH